jgi:hypothetical protein
MVLALASCKEVPTIDECFCPFYGALFRPAGHFSLNLAADETDVEMCQNQKLLSSRKFGEQRLK